jgi:hypothetical protein
MYRVAKGNLINVSQEKAVINLFSYLPPRNFVSRKILKHFFKFHIKFQFVFNL